MKILIYSRWHDIHAAHIDPFRGGELPGHLWRVQIGMVQDMDNAFDVRNLNWLLAQTCEYYDHKNLGNINTEGLAVRILERFTMVSTVCNFKIKLHTITVEEVGVCTVVMEVS